MKRRGRPPYPDILTPREWEVLGLLRAGLTNEQIAQQLGISLQGAKFHVSEILGKLQLPDRRAAAQWEAPRHSRIAPAIAVLTFVPRKIGGVAQWRPVQFALAAGAAMSLAVVIGAVVVATVLLARSDRGDRTSGGRFVVGADVKLPLLLDGDRLGVSSLDGGAPTAITGAGSFSDVRYDAAGRLVYVDVSGDKPGFYRIEGGKPQLVVATPGLPQFGAAAWSTDGSRAAWIDGDGRLQVAAPDGSARTLRNGMSGFLWSPDSKRLITWATRGDKSWIIDARDGTTTASPAHAPTLGAWSNAGDVAWVEINGGNFTGITKLSREDGSGTRVLGSSPVPPEEYFPTLTFSPDGRWLAADTVAVPNAVTIVDTRSGAQFAPSCGACAVARGADPVWSADGTSLAWAQDGHVVIARTGEWAGMIVADGVPVAWSPDGSRIAYTRLDADRTSSTLYARPGSGGAEVTVAKLADTRGLADQLAWSPDSTQIVMPLQAVESSEVVSFDPKTGDLTRLPVAKSFASPDLAAPDGSAFYDGVNSVSPFDGGTTISTIGGVVGDWSTDGRRLLVAGRGHDIRGGGLSVFDLTTRATTVLLDGNVQDAVWSPDERRVAFVRDQRLGVLDVASGKVTMLAPQITAMSASNFLGRGYLAWSPDGKQLAVGDWRPAPINGSGQLLLVDADDGRVTKLATSDSSKRYFTFSPDGQRLAFTDNQSSVVVLDVTTHKTVATIEQSDSGQFAWAGNDAIIADGAQGITLAQIGGENELLVADTGGCRRTLIGWGGGRLVFWSRCAHGGL